MKIDSSVIRLALDASSSAPPRDVVRSMTPQIWIGSNVSFELGLFYDSTLISDISNVDSITVMVKSAKNKTSNALMSKTVPSSYFDPTTDAESWADGSKQHCVVTFDQSETVLPIESDSTAFWLVISALINSDVTVNCLSLIRSGGTVTFTSAGAHGLTDGQQVVIAGASPSDYNGTFTITVTGTSTFTYPIGTTPGAASGTITAGATVPRSVLLGAGALLGANAGQLIQTPVSVVKPTYLTAAESDARYVMALDLTTITNNSSNAVSVANDAYDLADLAYNTVTDCMPKAGGVFSGNVSFSGGLLTLLASLPTASYHAVPKVYVDTKALLLTGGTVTGGVIFSGGINTASLAIGSLSGVLCATAGTVSAATVNAPLSFTSGTLSILSANTSRDGYLTQANWNLFNGKQNAIAVASGTPITIPDGFTLTMVSASASASGYLSSTDWSTFNGKFSSGGGTLSGAVVISSGNFTMTSGNLVITAGNLTLSNGALALTTGGITLTAGSLTVTAGGITVASGTVALTNGALTMNTGNMTMTSGNLTLTSGSLTLGGGNITVSGGHVNVTLGNFNADAGVYLVGGIQVLAGPATPIADPDAITAASGADIANAADITSVQALADKVTEVLNMMRGHHGFLGT